MADSAKIKKAISEILEDADLTTITAKKVRQQLEAKLKTDLTERKKEIDAMVMEIIDQKNEQEQEGSEEDEPSEDEGKKAGAGKRRKRADSESADEYVPEKKAKGKKKAADSDDSGDDWAKKKKSASASKGGAGAKKKGGTGFTKVIKLSPELSSVMGQPEMARHEVVKKIWSIIKEKNLYDPKNKQFAICNEELLPVFGVKRFRTFGMMKHLKNHFIN
ncbi:Upstream activation factor subunit spp27 [Orchesella cincta]|uniref:Upstream activation factor subunit spp27 n=1 Tax=Orchesella cincta TaxID=48709 RepID=A0A1D2NMG9_ORCCI|nr:Upstream activation factor subunit spp27 [Orchesella cincta]